MIILGVEGGNCISIWIRKRCCSLFFFFFFVDFLCCGQFVTHVKQMLYMIFKLTLYLMKRNVDARRSSRLFIIYRCCLCFFHFFFASANASLAADAWLHRRIKFQLFFVLVLVSIRTEKIIDSSENADLLAKQERERKDLRWTAAYIGNKIKS